MSRIVWSDEFDRLDLASTANPRGKWRPSDTNQDLAKGYADFGSGGHSSWNCSPEQSLGGVRYNPFSIEDGALVITTRRTPDSARQDAQGCPWLTGFLVSNSLNQTFSYGYFEFRMKLDQQLGGFPALWFYAATPGNAAGQNKGGAEIDLMEVFGNAAGSPIRATLHSATNGDGPPAIGTQEVAVVAEDTADWHTYALDWTQDHLHFYYDGVMFGEAKPDFVEWLAGLQMDIRINVAMDAEWFPAEEKSTESTTGVRMSVDYVRVYSSKPSSAAPPPPTPIPLFPVAPALPRQSQNVHLPTVGQHDPYSEQVTGSVQVLLLGRGFEVPVTGIWDDATTQAVMAFQAQCAITSNGIVDAATWTRLLMGEQR